MYFSLLLCDTAHTWQILWLWRYDMKSFINNKIFLIQLLLDSTNGKVGTKIETKTFAFLLESQNSDYFSS